MARLGMVPPLITVSIVKSISFSVYESSKRTLLHQPLLPFRSESLPSYAALCFLSGAASGAFIALLSCPFELVKVQKQLEQLLARSGAFRGSPLAHRAAATVPGSPVAQRAAPLSPVSGGPHTASSWQAAKDLYKLRGIRGLYIGLGSHTIRDSLGTGLYFCAYETTKRLLSSPESPPGPLTHFFAGGVCGVVSWLLIFPVDLVKSVIQRDALVPGDRVQHRGFFHCLTDIYCRQGPGALYRGISVSLLRAFPIHSLNFLVYEGVLSYIRRSDSVE
ncbi:hypothetical protein IWQ60_002758 [Tieghemiomyces parasiticus]|uniref:Uncharacterized protein n=1 Tax=Tieghemiomyces parasiticus TaxID=78921 RepID=A0A9W8AE83_9FUNG|nr:hypothetical protein IWQ60_002758 [Tieghemiomyces parasiticus]